MMRRKWFVKENTNLDEDSLEILNRAVRMYLFGTTKKDVTREDLSRLRLAFAPGKSASELANELHKDRDGKMTKQSDAKPMAHPTLACPDSKLAELVSRWEARPQSNAEPVAWRYRYRVTKDHPWSNWVLMPNADGKEVCDKYPENYETQGLGVISAPPRPDISAGLIEAAEIAEEWDSGWGEDQNTRVARQTAIEIAEALRNRAADRSTK